MPGPWLLLALAMTLTVAGIPGGQAQQEVAQQEAAMAGEHAALDNLLRQAERLLLLREDLLRLRLRGNQGDGESGEGWVLSFLPEAAKRAGGNLDAEVGSHLVIQTLAFQKLRNPWP